MQVGASGAILAASGGIFQVSYIVTDPAVSSGSTVTIVTSSDGTNWTQNSPTITCVLDANKTCSFTTDHLGLFAFVSTTSAPVPPTPDTTPPVVTLSGASIISIPQGSVYTDAGASWTDNRDGS